MNAKNFAILLTLVSSVSSQKVFAGKGSGATGGLSLTELFEDAVAGSIFTLNGESDPYHRMPTYLNDSCSTQDIQWLTTHQLALKERFASYSLIWVDTDVESVESTTEVQTACAVASGSQVSISVATCRPLIQNRTDAMREMAIAVMESAFDRSRAESQSIAQCFSEIVYRDFSYYLGAHGDFFQNLDYMRDRPDPAPEANRDKSALDSLLTSTREITARSLEHFANAGIPASMGKYKSIIDWLYSRTPGGDSMHALLAQDIRQSKHLIEAGIEGQNTCAHTEFSAAADVMRLWILLDHGFDQMCRILCVTVISSFPATIFEECFSSIIVGAISTNNLCLPHEVWLALESKDHKNQPQAR